MLCALASTLAGGGRAADENGHLLTAFAYPHGATVTAQAPAVAFLSSGQVAHPCNMTVGEPCLAAACRSLVDAVH